MGVRTLLAALVGTACFLGPRAPDPLRPAPATVTEAAARAVRRELGDSFYAAMVTPLPHLTRFHPASPGCSASCLWPWRTAYYVLFFSLESGHSSLPRGLIVVPIDTGGGEIPGFSPKGAPRCAIEPTECVFSVSMDSARATAAAAGLPSGIRPWVIRFVWLEMPKVGSCEPCWNHFVWPAGIEFPTYGWEVRAVTDTTGHSERGHIFVIDANDGRLLTRIPYNTFQ
jgi:hypothetical protein